MRAQGRSGVTRRAVLLAAAAAPLAGCGADLSRLRDVRLDDGQPSPEPSPGPDELARRDAARAADALQRATEAAAVTAPEPLAGLLTAVAAGHGAQLEALGGSGPAPGTPPPATADAVGLPGAQSTAAFAALAPLQRVSGPMARLLASVAAADAVHAQLLASAQGQPEPEPPSPVTAATEGRWSGDLDDAAAAALGACLDGEYAAAHGYGYVAARLDDGARDVAQAALAAHEHAAARLGGLLRDAGRDVPAPAPAYELPDAGRDPAALALLLEERTATLHATAVARTDDGARLLAADLLVGAALRAAAWRGAAAPLPGLVTTP